MLISRLQFRVISIAAVLALLALGLLYSAESYPEVAARLPYGNEFLNPSVFINPLDGVKQRLGVGKASAQKTWLYAGPEAQDKAVIMAKVHTEDVSWAYEHLSESVLRFYNTDQC